MADEEEEKEYRWETGYEKTWYIYIYMLLWYYIKTKLIKYKNIWYMIEFYKCSIPYTGRRLKRMMMVLSKHLLPISYTMLKEKGNWKEKLAPD